MGKKKLHTQWIDNSQSANSVGHHDNKCVGKVCTIAWNNYNCASFFLQYNQEWNMIFKPDFCCCFPPWNWRSLRERIDFTTILSQHKEQMSHTYVSRKIKSRLCGTQYCHLVGKVFNCLDNHVKTSSLGLFRFYFLEKYSLPLFLPSHLVNWTFKKKQLQLLLQENAIV